jgi:sporulation protein YlmC with PRC-barrel domain
MASSNSAGRDNHLVGTLNRRPAMRITARDYRPTLRRDAVLLGTTSFRGDSVYDVAGKFLGEIEELVLDLQSGRIAYALLVAGSFLGMGRKWFAIPWSTVTLDRVYRRCVINIDLERLIDAPSLDGDILPRMADPGWAKEVHTYFGCKPYWE